MKNKYLFILLFSAGTIISSYCNAQDTLRVVVQNVLHYGDGCQGSNAYLHSKLKNVTQFTNPDVLGLVKVQAIRINSSDFNGASPIGFADSIIDFALDPATSPGKYAYCTLTTYSKDADGDMDVLFYNQNKLGFVSVTNLCDMEEDFDLYKLYYKDTNLATTHDTTFIYFVLNHTDSGTLSIRDEQDSLVIQGLRGIFYHLPNLVSMGDFNVATSAEPGYIDYTAPADTSFIFDDAPFKPDGKFTYPLDWNKDVATAGYDNTTTRISTTPNSCGATGGAKDWIEHILMSKWITDSIDYVTYIKNSYTTIGNDGKHFEISINDSTAGPKNISAPDYVINSLFDLSDKYPVMIKLKVNSNVTGTGPVNPVNGIATIPASMQKIVANNPMHDNLTLHFPPGMIGKKVLLTWYDMTGRCIAADESFTISSNEMALPNSLQTGMYLLYLQMEQYCIALKVVKD